MSLEPTDEELEALREILVYVVPIALLLAGLGGWFLAHRSLSPVVAMADRARQIGVEDLSGRLPVANPRDELGRLAETFNDLLGRLETSLTQQRQFMADASHELRTPVTTSRTAASVALQLPHRDESEYRETLTSSSNRRSACRGSSTTCSPWRGRTREITRFGESRCIWTKSSTKWSAPHG